jgi:hypothetical protein
MREIFVAYPSKVERDIPLDGRHGDISLKTGRSHSAEWEIFLSKSWGEICLRKGLISSPLKGEGKISCMMGKIPLMAEECFLQQNVRCIPVRIKKRKVPLSQEERITPRYWDLSHAEACRDIYLTRREIYSYHEKNASLTEGIYISRAKRDTSLTRKGVVPHTKLDISLTRKTFYPSHEES